MPRQQLDINSTSIPSTTNLEPAPLFAASARGRRLLQVKAGQKKPPATSPRAPAFQFYAADYLADEHVALMTLEEEGAYIRALAYCWREGSIPADDDLLSRLLKGASAETLAVVKCCFEPISNGGSSLVEPNSNGGSNGGSRLVHPRLEQEREKQRLWREKSASAGKASGKARREKKFHTEPKSKVGSVLVEPKSNSSSSSSSSFTSAFSPSASDPPPLLEGGEEEKESPPRSGRGEGTPPSPAAGAFSQNPKTETDAYKIATAVVSETSITNNFAFTQLVRQAELELKEHPGDLDEIKDGMVEAWEEYMQCAKARKLRSMAMKAERFFGDGIWKKTGMWGLKAGMVAYEAKKEKGRILNKLFQLVPETEVLNGKIASFFPDLQSSKPVTIEVLYSSKTVTIEDLERFHKALQREQREKE